MSEFISANEIIEIASAHGYQVTKNQLARWRRHGLFTTVQRRFPGGGSESYFINSETNRAIEIAALLEYRSNLDWVGWQLWFRGYCVPERYWRPHLRNAFKQIEIVSKLGRSVSEFSDKRWLRLIKLVWLASSAPTAFKRSRKAVGKDDFPEFVGTILQVAGGEFNGLSAQPELNDEDRVRGARFLDRAMGLRGAREHHGLGGVPWLVDDISPELRDLSDAFHAHGNQVFFNRLSDQHIFEARDELVRVREMVFNQHDCAARAFGNPHALGLRVVVAILSEKLIRIQAALLAVWTLARTNPTLHANTERWLAENQEFKSPALSQSDAQPRQLKRKTNVFPYGNP